MFSTVGAVQQIALVGALALPYGAMLVMPGPNACIVLQASITRRAGLLIEAPLGVACGAGLAALTAATCAPLLPQGPVVRIVCGAVAALILLRAAVKNGFGAGAPSRSANSTTANAFVGGLLTALGNPMSVPFFASFFVSHACSRETALLASAAVFAMAATWFTAFGFLASRLTRLAWPSRVRHGARAILSAALVGAAVRLVWTAAAA